MLCLKANSNPIDIVDPTLDRNVPIGLVLSQNLSESNPETIANQVSSGFVPKNNVGA